MLTPSTAPSWGPVITYGNHGVANLGGCIATLTGDAAAGGCAQTIQLTEQCEQRSCTNVGCPADISADAAVVLDDCREQALLTTCSTFAAGSTECESANQYDDCVFADFQADFIGLGEIFGASGGGTDSGPDLAHFTGTEWVGTNTITVTCGTAPPVATTYPFDVVFSPDGSAGFTYSSNSDCVFDFTVSGDTATLSNAPVVCTGMVGDAGETVTDTISAYSFTSSDGVSLPGQSTASVTTSLGGAPCMETTTFTATR